MILDIRNQKCYNEFHENSLITMTLTGVTRITLKYKNKYLCDYVLVSNKVFITKEKLTFKKAEL
jgi:hypothetical protein